MKDIYGMRPNICISFAGGDTDRMVDILNSIYGFKEVGTHSPYTKDYVQYWYVENFGIIKAYMFSAESHRRCLKPKYCRYYLRLIKLLEASGIQYKIEFI